MRKVWILLLCALLLSACGDLDDYIPEPEPDDRGLAEFEEQEVNWAVCDPDLFFEGLVEPLAALGDRLECATLKTPLDWGNPSLDSVNLGVLRVKAGDESKRKGAILTNPGGPGGDGLSFGALLGLVFAEGSIEEFGFPSAAPELLTQVSEEYDIVGFSPRGVGGSFQYFCGSNATVPPTNFYTDRSEENVQAQLETAEVVAEACLNNPLYQYLDTEQTARDMDLIRIVLGDEKMNFLGYSYGSWLGAWYAKLFPENSGNIVLDGNVEFSIDWQKTDFDFVMGFERAFREVALPYAARNNAVFGLGDTADEIYEIYDALERELKGALVQGDLSIIGDLYSSALVGEVALKLVAAAGVQSVIETFGPVTQDTIEAFLEEVEAYTYLPDEDTNAAVREIAVLLAEDYFFFLEESLDRAERDIALSPGGALYTAITCNDSPWSKDPQFRIEKGDELNELYPLLGGGETSQPCTYWPEPTTAMPDVPENISPILMVQNGYDAATPSEGAVAAFKTLPDAKFLYVENEMTHTSFPYNTECLDATVAAYLLDGSLPKADITNCQAKPLPGEDEVYPPGTAPTLGDPSISLQAASEPIAPNPFYNLVHEILRENAAEFFRR